MLAVAFSPDGKIFITGGKDQHARGSGTRRPGGPLVHRSCMTARSFPWRSARKERYPYGLHRHDDALWDTAGKPIGQPLHYRGDSVSVASSRGGKALFTGVPATRFGCWMRGPAIRWGRRSCIRNLSGPWL